ncbi:MAG: N-acetylmuramoyl-L-alanine amidase [candidate division WOR-3 bacterium]
MLKNRDVKTIYDRKTKQYTARHLWILRISVNTAVLIECGFVSNPEEASKMDIDLDVFNERMSVEIFKGIDKILKPKGGELA